MSKRKAIDKVQARERRNQLLESAAAAELSITEGVREMRAISGMTQEEFARHRNVSARVIKALELGQGNPTVATLNRIGEYFGLEVAFVPRKRALSGLEASPPATWTEHSAIRLPVEAERSNTDVDHRVTQQTAYKLADSFMTDEFREVMKKQLFEAIRTTLINEPWVKVLIGSTENSPPAYGNEAKASTRKKPKKSTS